LIKYRNYVTAALGYFDGVHLGHREVLKSALVPDYYESAVFTFNSRIPCNITTDDTKHKLIRELGIEQIHSYNFESLKDYSPEEFVEKILVKGLNAKFVYCGFDFRFGKKRSAFADDLARICGEYGIVTIIKKPVIIDGITVSSSHIRELIHEGNIKIANKFLGYELFYELEVVGGNRLGRTIGFPTINQNMPQNVLPPKFGVYKSRVSVKGVEFKSITNIGIKPTAGENKNITIETHIIGYDGDLYGKVIKVSLLDFVRAERKFTSFEELSQQIKNDLEVIK